MIYEYYTDLAKQKACPKTGKLPDELAAGFVDGCTVWSTRGNSAKNKARQCYMWNQNAKPLALPSGLSLEPDFNVGLRVGWLALEIPFTLKTPWYSKDDRVFHVLDNPVRKDRIFGVPFMAAASWKGMLRWACRMQVGLREHLRNGNSFEKWQDPPWILHLFGNEKGESEHGAFHQGALVFYPTWFDRIGFEVINPHNRARRAGTQPIYYEVVPPGAKGILRLLYAPLPGAAKQDGIKPGEAIEQLLEAIEQLLTTYGISAKRTVGWGTVKIEMWRAYRKGSKPIEEATRENLWNKLQACLAEEGQP